MKKIIVAAASPISEYLGCCEIVFANSLYRAWPLRDLAAKS